MPPTPSSGVSSPGPESPETPRDMFRDAIRYWELRRIGYNLALVGLATGWVVVTWPHFRPSFTVASLLKLLVLAALANLCYCAAYLIDIRPNSPPPATAGAAGAGSSG